MKNNRYIRHIWLFIGFAALLLASLGIILPLLPVTPFILVAVYAFARSSKRYYRWLIEHKVFGSLIENWQEHKAIDIKSKTMSTISIVAILIVSIILGVNSTLIWAQGFILTGVVIFLLSRPLPPQDKKN